MDLIKQAEIYCKSYKYRFTEPRERVLEAIVKQKDPVTAYDILRLLSTEKDIKPPTIYRAIDFWLKHGFIHRIESMNCYIVCNFNHKHKGTQILICEKCGTTKETCVDDKYISDEISEKESFLVHSWSMEIRGICSKCA
ncbi:MULTISPECIES: Fur family transcriptional regulator [unclassified Francisella]|uniref:Fur family transcriptional regulator n=1 Tax=unclassified Francisella TaxID=2610885 RepID=UPI002E36FB17|nr:MULTISPECIES: Fur family transcriptional regulator [unclassified Francisella]MED7820164.1 Fur family transcriptional regulator [Francisella sp. 19S2-4]MED7830988.1 Fur family transcriptional regulator [Francisella sp. 19S2-10]